MSDTRYKPIIMQEHDAESRRLRAILDTATDEIYIYKLTKQTADFLGITIEDGIPSHREKKETYICDPEKNTECKKTSCQTLCFETTDPRYRKEDE